MVAILEPILREFLEEARATRRVAERVPPGSAGGVAVGCFGERA